METIAPQKDEMIIEIGAGRGALTFPLVKSAGHLIALEKDPALILSLKKDEIANLTILEADVLKISFEEICRPHGQYRGRVKIVGSLPYSISSPLLFKVLEARKLFSGCVFLVQKEVAERIMAQPGSKKYAPLSILFQIHFTPKIDLVVRPSAFSPPPKVDSALVSLIKRDKPLIGIPDENRFSGFLRVCFARRRKTLRNNLAALALSPARLEDAYQKLGLEPRIRPEQLAISQFARLFCLLHDSGAATVME